MYVYMCVCVCACARVCNYAIRYYSSWIYDWLTGIFSDLWNLIVCVFENSFIIPGWVLKLSNNCFTEPILFVFIHFSQFLNKSFRENNLLWLCLRNKPNGWLVILYCITYLYHGTTTYQGLISYIYKKKKK